MGNMSLRLFCIFVFLFCDVTVSKAGLFNWFSSKNVDETPVTEDTPVGSSSITKIPFELTVLDQKFLAEAKKYTSIELSQLDVCHHKVILSLRQSCNELTEEAISKLSVQLMNCQSAVEDRKVFPCSEEMTIKECTSEMDSNEWNSYHIISNRARAVCYSIRQQQFRAMTEMAVNKLVHSADQQIRNMELLEDEQQKLSTMTTNTLNFMSVGQQALTEQQQKLQASQQEIQLYVAQNLQELSRERSLIAAGQKAISDLTDEIKRKLDDAQKQMQTYEGEQQVNHELISKDLLQIQEETKKMWLRIDEMTSELVLRNNEASRQYELTLSNLGKINSTVSDILVQVEKMMWEFTNKFGWILETISGTGQQVSHIYTFLTHIGYLLLGMLCAAFLNMPIFSRASMMLIIPLNLIVEVQHGSSCDFQCLTVFILATVLGQWIVQYIWSHVSHRFSTNDQQQPSDAQRASLPASGASTSSTEQDGTGDNLRVAKCMFGDSGLLNSSEMLSAVVKSSSVQRTRSFCMKLKNVEGTNTPVTQDTDNDVTLGNDTSFSGPFLSGLASNSRSSTPRPELREEASQCSSADVHNEGTQQKKTTLVDITIAKRKSALDHVKRQLNEDLDVTSPLNISISSSRHSVSRSSTPVRLNRSGTPLCSGICKSGNACKQTVSTGNVYCYHHSNQEN